ncbi:putative nuclease of restriction endonuclease-like (RecB) superfamily [Kineococcus radiotolerans]|uniref:Putative nuclease of restriction endonuclease-like (RecB) superfamily n=1 Tax=Kineococcus radiotolerans TaxID=131568 RepID=A0A7W4TQJ0_KINRA|nr:DUF1016 N-terminal domain-containing protein [Kineococcus radiotolerans]MBB2903276.1 putative nuclease of restriction endonuclease-like (RecB) superfamily [Kineococcus radiotolerans]
MRAAITELLRLHHSIGRDILQRQHDAGWGAEVIDRLAHDLRDAFPDQRDFSSANLRSMRAFAATWPDQESLVQQAVGQLPWGHITVLLARTKDPAVRDWYAAAAVEHGWSRNVLTHQINRFGHGLALVGRHDTQGSASTSASTSSSWTSSSSTSPSCASSSSN